MYRHDPDSWYRWDRLAYWLWNTFFVVVAILVLGGLADLLGLV